MALKTRQSGIAESRQNVMTLELMELTINRLIGRIDQVEEEINSLYAQVDEFEAKLAHANRSYTVDIMSKPFFTITECAAYTGMARSTIYKLTSLHEIPFFKKGKFVFFERLEIDKWLQNGKQIPSKAELEAQADKYIEAHSKKKPKRTKNPCRR